MGLKIASPTQSRSSDRDLRAKSATAHYVMLLAVVKGCGYYYIRKKNLHNLYYN